VRFFGSGIGAGAAFFELALLVVVVFFGGAAPSPAPVFVSFFFLIAIQLPCVKVITAESNPQASIELRA
jgi:hypothetical protein